MQKRLSRDELKELIKEGIREVLREERLGLCEIMIPHLSKKELREIQIKLGSPGNYREEDFVDMTAWVKA